MTVQEMTQKITQLKAQIRTLKADKREGESSPKPQYGWITMHGKTFQYEMTPDEAKEHNKRMRNVRFAMRMAEMEREKAYELEHANGYCPECYLLLPTGTKKCPNCN